MRLGEAQRLFARRLPRLIDYINDNGYECTLGDAYRDPRSHGKMGHTKVYGQPKSAHKQRLAIDLNLFLDGVYLTDSESYRLFAEYWVSLDPENHVSGIDFNDANHFSFRYNGIA